MGSKGRRPLVGGRGGQSPLAFLAAAPTPAARMKARSVLAGLAATPRRFRFDAAVRVLTRARQSADPAEVMRFRTPPGTVFPPADVLEVNARGPQPELT